MVFLGSASPASGPALQGYTVEGSTLLVWGSLGDGFACKPKQVPRQSYRISIHYYLTYTNGRCNPFAITPLTKHISFCRVQGSLKYSLNMREPAPVLPSTLTSLSSLEVRRQLLIRPIFYNLLHRLSTPRNPNVAPYRARPLHPFPYLPGL